jgi:hypothetical protein
MQPVETAEWDQVILRIDNAWNPVHRAEQRRNSLSCPGTTGAMTRKFPCGVIAETAAMA